MSADLTPKLLIEFQPWTTYGPKFSTFQLQQERPDILVLGTDDEETALLLREAYINCRRWLVRTANLLRKVQLYGREPTPWQLRDILSVLQPDCLQAPPVLKLMLAAGSILNNSGPLYLVRVAVKHISLIHSGCDEGAC